MNTVFEQIQKRQSTRHFLAKEVTPEIKQALIQSAFEAPTAGGMMYYSIIDINHQELKDKLAVLCDNQPFIAKAPLVFIFLADCQRWYDNFKVEGCQPRSPQEGDLLLACADAIIAAQNTVVAAESFGLGSCYIGDILENCEQLRDLLALPDYVLPAAMLVYGYPDPTKIREEKIARFDPQYIVYENAYKRLSPEEFASMQQSLLAKRKSTSTSHQEYIKRLCDRKYASDFSLEMSRSAKIYLKPFQE